MKSVALIGVGAANEMKDRGLCSCKMLLLQQQNKSCRTGGIIMISWFFIFLFCIRCGLLKTCRPTSSSLIGSVCTCPGSAGKHTDIMPRCVCNTTYAILILIYIFFSPSVQATSWWRFGSSTQDEKWAVKTTYWCLFDHEICNYFKFLCDLWHCA